MPEPNLTPEQKARVNIDKILELAGWIVQDKKKIDFSAGLGVAIREYGTDVGPADYVLFVDKKAEFIKQRREAWQKGDDATYAQCVVGMVKEEEKNMNEIINAALKSINIEM